MRLVLTVSSAINCSFSVPIPTSDNRCGIPRFLKNSSVFSIPSRAASYASSASMPHTFRANRANLSTVLSHNTYFIHAGVKIASPEQDATHMPQFMQSASATAIGRDDLHQC